jgi:hypothetical protein
MEDPKIQCACLGGEFTSALRRTFNCLAMARASREDIREKSPCKGLLNIELEVLVKELNQKCGFSMDRTKIIEAMSDIEEPTNPNIDKAFHKLNALVEEYHETCIRKGGEL